MITHVDSAVLGQCFQRLDNWMTLSPSASTVANAYWAIRTEYRTVRKELQAQRRASRHTLDIWIHETTQRRYLCRRRLVPLARLVLTPKGN